MVGRTIGVAVFVIDELLRPVPMVAVDIADGDDLDLIASEEAAHDTRAPAAYTDAAMHDPVARRDAAVSTQSR